MSDVTAPADFVPSYAITFGDFGELARAVSPAQPLPVSGTTLPSGVAALAGSASASARMGPFTPQLDRTIWLTLGGTWTGSATLLRSVDAGAALWPATIGGIALRYAAAINEPVAQESEAGATWCWTLRSVRAR